MEEINPREKGGLGPVIGAIVIVLILVLGAFYFFTTHTQPTEMPPSDTYQVNGSSVGETDPQTEAELNAELESMNAALETFDQELSDLENTGA